LQVASFITAVQETVLLDFLNQISNLEDFIDTERLRKIIFEEGILTKMSPNDFEEYRTRIFNTNLTFFEKAIENSKHGTKRSKVENRYLSEISSNFDTMKKEFARTKQMMRRINLFMNIVTPESLENLRLNRAKWGDNTQEGHENKKVLREMVKKYKLKKE